MARGTGAGGDTGRMNDFGSILRPSRPAFTSISACLVASLPMRFEASVAMQIGHTPEPFMAPDSPIGSLQILQGFFGSSLITPPVSCSVAKKPVVGFARPASNLSLAPLAIAVYLTKLDSKKGHKE
ncbi:MAG TPA: hypothetical protein VHA30_01715 [Patescibacteria group bacterium]|nr:hypothetical protein [Patescibacteria group bacterium]